MKGPFLLLSLFSSVLAFPQDTKGNDCEANCPLVHCVTDDARALCECINNQESLCKDMCPTYKPNFLQCPGEFVHVEAAESDPATCECEEDILCIQSWPESCHCENDAKKACFDKCGGEEPEYSSCIFPDDDGGASSPDVVPVPEPTGDCKCTKVECIQVIPESCYCANYADELCYRECGGDKPVVRDCGALVSPRFTTSCLASSPTPRSRIPARQAASRHTNQRCGSGGGGGGGAPYPPCPVGQACIADPFEAGSCGPACDQPGICVQDKLCGGFAGFQCDKQGQVCVDDPRDDCHAENGGWDCGGVCVWPPR